MASPLYVLPLIVNMDDPQKAGLLASFGASTPSNVPLFFESNTVGVSLRCVAPTANPLAPWADVNISADTVTLGIGNQGANPTGGAWTLGFGANTATGLAWNISAAALSTALNALASVIAAGGVTVAAIGGTNFVVTFVSNGAQVPLASASNTLSPPSGVTVTSLQTGTGSLPSIQMVQLAVSLLAANGTWTPFASAAAVITSLQTGSGTAPSVQQVALVPVPYGGSFTLTTSLVTTGAIPWNATAAQLQTLLNANGMLAPFTRYTVTGPTGGPWQVSNNFTGADTAFTANVTGLQVPVGLIGALALNTLNMLQAFASAGATSLALTLGIDVTPAGTGPSTILQVPCIVQDDVIMGGVVPPVPTYPATVDFNAQTNNSGNGTILPGALIHTEAITVTGSGRTSSFVVSPPSAGAYPAGAKVFVNMALPATAGIVLKLYDQSTGGTLLGQITTDGYTSAAYYDITWNGTNYVLTFVSFS